MSDLLDVFGALVGGVMSGGATGLLGIALQQWGDIKKRQHDLEMLKQQHLQTLELRRIEGENTLKLASVNAESAERLAEIQFAARAEEMASSDYRASVENDKATYLAPSSQNAWYVVAMLGFVDFLRGLIRPGATIYSFVLLTMLLFWVHGMWQDSKLVLTPEDAKRLSMEVITTVTYLVVTLSTWWFGRRPEAPPKR